MHLTTKVRDWLVDVGDDVEGWREGCEDCKRRTQQTRGDVVNMDPPPIIVFECEYRVE